MPPKAGSPAAPTLSPQDRAKLAFNEGNRLVQSGKTAAAIAKYLEALHLDPTFVPAYNNLGILYVRQKQWARAEEVFRRIALLRPKEVEPLLQLAEAQQQGGQPGAARDSLRRAVTLSPRHIPARLLLAQSYEKEEQFAQAEEQLKAATAASPKSAPAWKALAGFYLRRKRTEEFVRAMERLWPLEPRNASLAYDLGVYAHQKKDWGKAVTYYRAAVRLNPKLQDAWQNLGAVYTELKRPGPAAEAFKKAAQLGPKDFKAQMALGVTQFNAGNAAGAETAFRQAVKLQPKNPDAREYLATALLQQKKLKEAEPIYARLRAEGNTNSAVLHNLGYIYSATGKKDRALALYEKAALAQPKDVTIRRTLAQLYWEADRKKDALKAMEEAVALAPDDLPTQEALGSLYVQMNRTADAATHFEKLAAKEPRYYRQAADLHRAVGATAKEIDALKDWSQADPENTQIIDSLASVYLREKQPAEALKTLEGALATRPNDPTLYLSLHKYHRDQGDPTKAAEILKEGLTKIPADSPSVPDFHMSLASLLEESKPEEALIHLKAAETTAPTVPAKVRAGIRIADLMEKKDAGAGEKQYQEVIRRYPNNFEARFRYALRLADKKNYAEALQQLQAGLLQDPAVAQQYPFPPFDLLRMWAVAAGNPAAGVAALESLLEKYAGQEPLIRSLAALKAAAANEKSVPVGENDPNLAYFRTLARRYPKSAPLQEAAHLYAYERGRHRESQGKTTEALSAYTEAARLAPKNPWYWSEVARVMESTGKKTEALAVYLQAQKMDPQNAAIQSAIQRLSAPEKENPK
ncbi:MAG: tetratricopeptide repeat protein [Armatimonadetes bacterium]|nr:tetratricopeptide repeat protein [Armatimonadota bacterium]